MAVYWTRVVHPDCGRARNHPKTKKKFLKIKTELLATGTGPADYCDAAFHSSCRFHVFN